MKVKFSPLIEMVLVSNRVLALKVKLSVALFPSLYIATYKTYNSLFCIQCVSPSCVLSSSDRAAAVSDSGRGGGRSATDGSPPRGVLFHRPVHQTPAPRREDE